jgi:hypothetical protein
MSSSVRTPLAGRLSVSVLRCVISKSSPVIYSEMEIEGANFALWGNVIFAEIASA